MDKTPMLYTSKQVDGSSRYIRQNLGKGTSIVRMNSKAIT